MSESLRKPLLYSPKPVTDRNMGGVLQHNLIHGSARKKFWLIWDLEEKMREKSDRPSRGFPVMR